MGSILKASIIGIFVFVVACLPPILHFITGPLGPIIGGFIGGTVVKATPKLALAIGGCMGAIGIFVCIGGLIVIMNNFVQDASGVLQVVAVSSVGGLYVGLFGGLGALIAAKLSRK